MKYLVLLVVLVVAVGIWRSRRAADASAPKPPPAPLALPQHMLACAHCGIHIPQAEALMSDGHAYCSDQHQRSGPA
jgi:uncharacterized protein